MASLKRRVVNPGPAFLVSVNPRKKRSVKNMAAKKKSGGHKAKHRVNPPKRRPSAHHRSGSHHARTSNASHHRKGHKRNPAPSLGGGTIGEAVNYTVAAFADGFAKPLVTNLVGSYMPFGQYNGPAITALSGFGVSWLLSIPKATARFARPALIVGLTAALIELLNPLIRNFLGASAPTPLLSGPRRQGMRDLVTLPAGNFDPYYGTTPLIAASTVPTQAAPGGGSQAAALKGLLRDITTIGPGQFGANYRNVYGR
jgi:hypothetical protein